MNKLQLVILLNICLTAALWAQPDGYSAVEDLEALKPRMMELSGRQNTIMSNFKQTKTMEYLSMSIESEGKFWYVKPDKVRWEYVNPYHYTIIISQGKLNLISGEKHNEFNMESSDVFEQVNKLMLGLVTGNMFESDNYNIMAFENSEKYLFRLIPGKGILDGVLKNIELYLDKKSGLVTEIVMTEAEDNYTHISFSNIQLNENISDKVFNP